MIAIGNTNMAKVKNLYELQSKKSESHQYNMDGGRETILTGRENGKGGLSTELCLVLVRQWFGHWGYGVLCAASDSNDGITDAAGAWFITDTLSKVTTIKEIDHYLHNKDSYTLFEKYNCLIRTGITNTNLNDVVVGWGG